MLSHRGAKGRSRLWTLGASRNGRWPVSGKARLGGLQRVQIARFDGLAGHHTRLEAQPDIGADHYIAVGRRVLDLRPNGFHIVKPEGIGAKSAQGMIGRGGYEAHAMGDLHEGPDMQHFGRAGIKVRSQSRGPVSGRVEIRRIGVLSNPPVGVVDGRGQIDRAGQGRSINQGEGISGCGVVQPFGVGRDDRYDGSFR